jgi:hypothetical protein
MIPSSISRTALVLLVTSLLAFVPASQAAWTTPIGLANTPNRFEVDANLAIDSAGNVHLVYQDFLDADNRYYYMHNMSGSWSTRELIGTAPGKGSVPIIVMTPDNMLHVIYGKTNIYWRTKPVIGGSWSSPSLVALNPDGGFTNHAVVDSSGGIYYMWGHLFDDNINPRNGVWGRYKPLGGNWGSTELVVGGGSDGNWHKGDFLFADGDTIWAGISYDGDVWYKKRPPGGPWPGGNGTWFANGGGLRFDKSPTNNEIAATYAWAISSGDTTPWFEVFVRYSYDGGNTWTTQENISNQTGLDRTQEMTYDASGNLHVAWQGAGCGGCPLHVHTKSRINGVWGSRVDLTPGGGQGGLVVGSLQAFGNTLHLGLSRNTNFWDMYYSTNELAPPPPTPPVVMEVNLSNDPLIADDTIQHTLTLRGSDINGASDLKAMRFLINYQGDNAGMHRGYVSWGATPADIGAWGGEASWDIQSVDSGSGYYGVRMSPVSFGADDYLTIHSVDESVFGTQRTVEFTFSVKPQYYTDGPLTDNDVSVTLMDSDGHLPWSNYDLDFRVVDQNYIPSVDSITISDDVLLPDDQTQYQITMQASDANGTEDMRLMRGLINLQGDNDPYPRAYFSWGQTENDIGLWGGVTNWDISPVDSGQGYWGIRISPATWGSDNYITAVSATESTAGNTRTFTMTFTVKPQWLTDGPLNDNDISGMTQDTYVGVSWSNFDLNFKIYPHDLDVPDFDRDFDVDLVDHADLQACMSGDSIPHPADCELADMDKDGDVDGFDHDDFINCWSGPDIVANSNCLN